MSELSQTVAGIIWPREFTHPEDVGKLPSDSGVYGWWFRPGSLDIPAAAYRQYDGFELLYVGISPRKPSKTGRVSKGNIKKRLHQHVNGNASQSTLRRTLGVLLMDELELTLELRNGRQRWGEESILTDWMYQNARVAYVVDDEPWIAEEELLSRETLSLNIDGRSSDEFARSISERRSAARAAARVL